MNIRQKRDLASLQRMQKRSRVECKQKANAAAKALRELEQSLRFARTLQAVRIAERDKLVDSLQALIEKLY